MNSCRGGKRSQKILKRAKDILQILQHIRNRRRLQSFQYKAQNIRVKEALKCLVCGPFYFRSNNLIFHYIQQGIYFLWASMAGATQKP